MLRAAGLPVEPSTTRGAARGAVAELVARASAGDPRALAAVADAGAALGTGIAAVVNLLDVGTVVLGGVYATLAPWLAGPVGDVVRRRVLGAPWAPVRVMASRLGGEAAVRGAATMVVRDVITDPAAVSAARAVRGRPWLARLRRRLRVAERPGHRGRRAARRARRAAKRSRATASGGAVWARRRAAVGRWVKITA